MTEFSWIPGTVVLLLGVAGGLWLASRLKRPSAAGAGEQQARDLELRIADLEARRDEIYRRLRGEGEDELGEREAAAFEKAAARVLRDLDQARAELAEVSPAAARVKGKKKKGAAPAKAKPEAAARQPAAAMRHPLLVGFLFGAGMVSLVGVLVYWALRDAEPGPRAAPEPGGLTEAAAPEAHPEELAGLSPEARSQAAALQAELERDPENLIARKQLAVLLVSYQQFVPAFQHAEEILRRDPDDPDALYIAGVVRLTMGQPEVSLQLIDRVLEQFPNHVLAHVVRGMALIRLGERDEALASWQRGIEASGGSNPDLERMIAEEFGPAAGGVPASGAAPAAPPPAAPPPTAAPAEAGAPRVYRVRVELAPGEEVTPGSSLFVSVHGGGGPPAAVKRVADPAFPLEVSLSASDSMMGIELPARGLVVLRLDRDGDPGTESPDDLTAQGEAASGELAKFILW